MLKRTKDLGEVVEALERGDLCALPTETVYGLAGIISKASSLEKIFTTKKRPLFDPLIVHVASLDQAKELCAEWPDWAEDLAHQFWPGPLTLVLPKNDKVNDLITSGGNTVALRMPKHPLTLEVLKNLKIPVAAPSANRFGKTSPTSVEHVMDEFSDESFFVLDGGSCSVGVESTVVCVVNDVLQILRPGGVTQEELQKACPHLKVTAKTSGKSPGHLEDHYQPDVPLYIVPEAWSDEKIFKQIGGDTQELSLGANAALAARELYSKMRSTRSAALFVRRKKSQKTDLWVPIWDRLKKASFRELSD